jgi:hypothetical protein
LKILKDLEEAKWEFIAPDTVDENLYKALCKQKERR